MSSTSTQILPAPPEPKPTQSRTSVNSLADGQNLTIREALDIEEPPALARVFEIPHVREVKGKVFSTIFAVTIAGMNDAAVSCITFDQTQAGSLGGYSFDMPDWSLYSLKASYFDFV